MTRERTPPLDHSPLRDSGPSSSPAHVCTRSGLNSGGTRTPAHVRTRSAGLLRSALVAALVAAGALIAVPIGPIPVTLQVLVVAVATLALTPVEAFFALALYAGLGAVGVPVFSGGGAGIGFLLGPTGGFIAGFVFGSPSGALVRRWIAGGTGIAAARRRELVADVLGLVVMLVIIYLAGWAYFALSTGRASGQAFALAVAPFVLIDIGKCAVAVVVARAVRAAGFGAR